MSRRKMTLEIVLKNQRKRKGRKTTKGQIRPQVLVTQRRTKRKKTRKRN